MNFPLACLRNFTSQTKAQATAEYTVLIIFVALIALTAGFLLRSQLVQLYAHTTDTLSGVNEGLAADSVGDGTGSFSSSFDALGSTFLFFSLFAQTSRNHLWLVPIVIGCLIVIGFSVYRTLIKEARLKKQALLPSGKSTVNPAISPVLGSAATLAFLIIIAISIGFLLSFGHLKITGKWQNISQIGATLIALSGGGFLAAKAAYRSGFSAAILTGVLTALVMLLFGLYLGIPISVSLVISTFLLCSGGSLLGGILAQFV